MLWSPTSETILGQIASIFEMRVEFWLKMVEMRLKGKDTTMQFKSTTAFWKRFYQNARHDQIWTFQFRKNQRTWASCGSVFWNLCPYLYQKEMNKRIKWPVETNFDGNLLSGTYTSTYTFLLFFSEPIFQNPCSLALNSSKYPNLERFRKKYYKAQTWYEWFEFYSILFEL